MSSADVRTIGGTDGIAGITRVQRSRAKGAALPPDTLCVGRPGRWGNWWRVVKVEDIFTDEPNWYVEHHGKFLICQSRDQAIQYAVAQHREWVWDIGQTQERRLFCRLIRDRGIHHLACWCPLDQPCHADNWIEVWQKEGSNDER